MCAGVHGFELIDNTTGCSVISSVEVSDIGGPDNSIVNTVNPTCFNGADGSASVIASGGTPPYNYNWIPSGQNTNVISGLSAGLYHLEVIDNNNCKLVVPVSITNPSAPLVEQLTENATCGLNNGAISLIVYQGNGSYSYSWNGPNGFSSNAKNVSNLEAGVYELTISDGNGCLYPYTFTINSDNGLTIDLIKTDISLNKSIDGEVFLEMDVFKEGYEDHGCWDFSIQWKRNLNIILLFDKNGYDRIGYVKSNDHCANSIIFNQMPSTTKNGKLQLSIFEKGFQVKYIDSLGNQITTSNSDLDNPYSKYFKIGLAAYSNSPRMIDNLKINKL